MKSQAIKLAGAKSPPMDSLAHKSCPPHPNNVLSPGTTPSRDRWRDCRTHCPGQTGARRLVPWLSHQSTDSPCLGAGGGGLQRARPWVGRVGGRLDPGARGLSLWFVKSQKMQRLMPQGGYGRAPRPAHSSARRPQAPTVASCLLETGRCLPAALEGSGCHKSHFREPQRVWEGAVRSNRLIGSPRTL